MKNKYLFLMFFVFLLVGCKGKNIYGVVICDNSRTLYVDIRKDLADKEVFISHDFNSYSKEWHWYAKISPKGVDFAKYSTGKSFEEALNKAYVEYQNTMKELCK